MDIISMQMANKALKRMNREFDGLYDVHIATAAQTDFVTSKAYEMNANCLYVYVNGAHALDTQDYTKVDDRTIRFLHGLREGDEVLISTQIVGVPKIVAPDYDDSALRELIQGVANSVTATNADLSDVKNDIADTNTDVSASLASLTLDVGTVTDDLETATSDLESVTESVTSITESVGNITANIAAIEQKIEGILTALDEDEDGSILDTLVDIKSQWAAADGELKTLINLKATIEDLELAVNRIKALEDVEPVYYNPLRQDAYTQRDYALTVYNGEVVPYLVSTPLAITYSGETAFVQNESNAFTFQITANDDLDKDVQLEIVASHDGVLLSTEDGTPVYNGELLVGLANHTVTLTHLPTDTTSFELICTVILDDTEATLGQLKQVITVTPAEPVDPSPGEGEDGGESEGNGEGGDGGTGEGGDSGTGEVL